MAYYSLAPLVSNERIKCEPASQTQSNPDQRVASASVSRLPSNSSRGSRQICYGRGIPKLWKLTTLWYTNIAGKFTNCWWFPRGFLYGDFPASYIRLPDLIFPLLYGDFPYLWLYLEITDLSLPMILRQCGMTHMIRGRLKRQTGTAKLKRAKVDGSCW